HDTERYNYDQVDKQAIENKSKLMHADSIAYYRFIDFEKFGEISQDIGALFMVDMAHIAGPIAVKKHPDSVPIADFVTSTTHKTLRGPRGGFILCKEAWGQKINSAVFPGVQGGPLMHVIADKAVAFGEVLQP